MGRIERCQEKWLGEGIGDFGVVQKNGDTDRAADGLSGLRVNDMGTARGAFANGVFIGTGSGEGFAIVEFDPRSGSQAGARIADKDWPS